MKRLILVLCLMLIVAPGMAAVIEDFQDDEFNVMKYNVSHGWGNIYWIASGTGGNSYGYAYPGTSQTIWMVNTYGQPMTYAAATAVDGWGGGTDTNIRMFASDMSVLGNCFYGGGGRIKNQDRMEMIVSGGTATFYRNGVASAVCSPVAVASNPYYVGFGSAGNHWDDMIFGSDQTYVYDFPNPKEFYIQKDVSNPANSGLAYIDNETLAQSTYLPYSWSKANANNETIVLVNAETGTIYETQYTAISTGSYYVGNGSFSLINFLNSSAPYGFYEFYIQEQGGRSEQLLYSARGATVSWDRDTYAPNDVANISWDIEGDYWGTYSDYRVEVMSATTYEVIDTIQISAQTGSGTFTFADDATDGTYFAILKADQSGSTYWLGFDYADLDQTVALSGYVTDQEGTGLSSANISIVQNDLFVTTSSGFNGNYSISGFYSGATTWMNVTNTGYQQYNNSVIFPSNVRVRLNFTLISLTRPAAGSTIGGVARDGAYDNTSRLITNGYGRPISGATVYIKNTTNSESYTRTTNVAGYYVCGETESCFLTPSRPYDLWGERGGYGNSQNYTAVAG